MNQKTLLKSISRGAVVILLALALSLILIFDAGPEIGQIVWNLPQLPTIEESITMSKHAKEADDTSLHPFCPRDYSQHMNAIKPDEEQLKDSKSGVPGCLAISGGIGSAPSNRGLGPRDISGSLARDSAGQIVAPGTTEPFDEATKAMFRERGLDFIAETGRFVVNELGIWEAVWDPPQLPTLGESTKMAARAVETGDRSLLPLCTDEYRQHMKTQSQSEERTNEYSKLLALGDGYPCRKIPDSVYFGPEYDRGLP